MQSKFPEDAALVEGWRRGDPLATDYLFRAHVEALRRFVNKRTSDDADDIVQQSILACLEARERLRDPSAFRAFLLSCARYTLFAQWRLRQRPTPAQDLGSTDDPESMAMVEQDVRGLHRALSRLPCELQQPLRMYYFERLPGRSIARTLAIPEGTVRSRVRRGLAHLRRSLRSHAASGSAREPPGPNRGIMPRCQSGR